MRISRWIIILTCFMGASAVSAAPTKEQTLNYLLMQFNSAKRVWISCSSSKKEYYNESPDFEKIELMGGVLVLGRYHKGKLFKDHYNFSGKIRYVDDGNCEGIFAGQVALFVPVSEIQKEKSIKAFKHLKSFDTDLF